MGRFGETRRDFLRSMGLGAAGLLAPGVLQAKDRAMKRPNILFLFTDDQRFNTLNALNNPEIITPNMDKLVKRGTAFTHAHIMGSMSGAVCMPSRAMLMSGRTLFHLRGQGQSIPQEHRMLPETLRRAGYATFGTGKWHNGPSAYARCFTHGAKIFFGGMSNHLKVPVHDFDPTGRYRREKRCIDKPFSSNLFSDAAIDFLKSHKGDKPFFMYVSYTAPHDPRMAPKEYADMYPPSKVRVPKNFMPEHPFDNGEMRIRDEKLAPWPRTPEIVQEHIAAYYAMITHLDAQIGRVLQALEETGQADNTIIVFAGDNGLAVGQHGLMGKQNLYEHSVRVPLLISGPGVPRGQSCDALCYLLDIYPTLCELLGVSIPESVEGRSLAPLLKDPKRTVRDSVFYVYKNVQRGVRSGHWKLIKYNVKGKQITQLFDLQRDPWEMKNLADDASHAARVDELTNLLKDWMRKTDDKANLDKPSWGVPRDSGKPGKKRRAPKK